jgi:membrane protease YdiL (CAAX protease family)
MAMFTAGLLRQSHDLTPTSPFLNPAVGSLLFACIVFLLLVAARERQIGPAPGPGVRVGSLTPIMLMLLVEKWVSSNFYPPAFAAVAPPLPADDADAWFRLLCGAGLLAMVALLSRFSKPATAWVRARVGPERCVTGLFAAVAAIASTAILLAAAGLVLGSSVSLVPPDPPGTLLVVLTGQSAIALGEEAYYRGLLLGELLRLGPRLGLPGLAARRWAALAMTSTMFGMEHLGAASSWSDGLQQSVFALSLGALLGLLVLLTANIWFAAAMHAWINFLLLDAAPGLAYGPSQASVPAGATVSLALIGAFIAAFLLQRRPSPSA